jgi:hypothetical protein
MWNEAERHGNRNWVWIERNPTYSPDGTRKEPNTEYENIRMWVTRSHTMMKDRKKGVINTSVYYIIISKFDLEYWDLTPHVNKTFFRRPDGVTFKTIGIMDYTNDPDYLCYYLTVKREEI